MSSVSTEGTAVDPIFTQPSSGSTDSMATSSGLEPGVTSTFRLSGLTTPPTSTMTMPSSLAESRQPFTSLETLKMSSVSTEGTDVDTIVTQTSSGSVDTMATSSALEPGVTSTLGLSIPPTSTMTMPTSLDETRQPFTSFETLKMSSVSTEGTAVDPIFTQPSSGSTDSMATSSGLEPGVTSTFRLSGLTTPPTSTMTMPSSLAETRQPFTSLETLKMSSVSTEGTDVDTIVTQTSSGSVDTMATSSALEPGVTSTLGLSIPPTSTMTMPTSLDETRQPFTSFETLKMSSVPSTHTAGDTGVPSTVSETLYSSITKKFPPSVMISDITPTGSFTNVSTLPVSTPSTILISTLSLSTVTRFSPSVTIHATVTQNIVGTTARAPVMTASWSANLSSSWVVPTTMSYSAPTGSLPLDTTATIFADAVTSPSVPMFKTPSRLTSNPYFSSSLSTSASSETMLLGSTLSFLSTGMTSSSAAAQCTVSFYNIKMRFSASDNESTDSFSDTFVQNWVKDAF
uniref:Galactose-specific cell agglutination protein gsf2-like n=1 Tax=Phascolarctos cinereus TaxID=38626 RepID=A0A6P5J292_PHACI|nr:galactose-specific cell agglutination protein gsf2-like [Phascolarctos cinereus]